MRSFVVVGLILVMSSGALAGTPDAKRLAAAKAMFDAQRKALTKDDDAAFGATLAKDAVVSWGSELPTADFTMKLTFVAPSKITVTTSKIGWAGTWGWLTADVRATWTMYAEPEGAGDPHPKPQTDTIHWVAFLVADGEAVKTRALFTSHTVPDKELPENNFIQDELEPEPSPPARVAALTQPATLAKELSKDPATTVFVTGPSERGFGPAAAKKLLSSWGKLTLEVATTKKKESKDDYKVTELVVGDAVVSYARIRLKLPGQKQWTLVNGFSIARKTDAGHEVVALAYSAWGS